MVFLNHYFAKVFSERAGSARQENGLILPVNLAYVRISLFKNNPGFINGFIFMMEQVLNLMQVADILLRISSLPAIGPFGVHKLRELLFPVPDS
jgi:hypothetical protein